MVAVTVTGVATPTGAVAGVTAAASMLKAALATPATQVQTRTADAISRRAFIT